MTKHDLPDRLHPSAELYAGEYRAGLLSRREFLTRASALGVSASEVSYQLKRVQINSSGGRADVGHNVQSFRTLGAVGAAMDIATLSIPLADGRSVRGQLAVQFSFEVET